MEHSLHLGAGHFVRGVTPTTSYNILKKVKFVVQDACDHRAYDLDQLDAKLEDIEDGSEDGNGNGDDIADEDSRVEYGVADIIGKVLALMNQVSIWVLGSLLHLIESHF